MLLVFIVYHFDCLALFVILIFVHRIEDSQDDVPKKLPSLVHFFPTSTDSDSTTLACSRSFSDEIPLSYCLSSPQVSGATISTIGPKPLKPALVTHSHSENSLGKQNTNFFRVFLKHIVWVIIRLKVRMMFYYLSSVSIGQFSWSVVSDSLWHDGMQHARPPCPSPTPGVHSNSCPSSQWCHTPISSSVVLFSSCPQSFPASGSFPMSQLFASGGQRIGVSALASVLPLNIQDWFPLGWTGWISLWSKGLSRVFPNTTV